MRRRHAALTALVTLAVLGACAPAEPPPPEPPPEVIGGTIAAADGVPIVYDAKGAGDLALVFIHCWACDREFWREQVDFFAQSYRVVAMDLPGHGASGADRASWTLTGLADDVRTVVDALELERVVLVGHSMGGPLALMAAPLLEARVLGAVCLDTLHDAEQKWDEEMAAPIITAYEEDFATANERIVQMLFPEEADPEVIDWVVARSNATHQPAAIALMNDFPSLDIAEIMAAAGVPIRCVNAAPLGQIIPETAVETNRQYADFGAVTIEGVGHYLQLERPDEVNQKLAEAVAELTGN